MELSEILKFAVDETLMVHIELVTELGSWWETFEVDAVMMEDESVDSMLFALGSMAIGQLEVKSSVVRRVNMFVGDQEFAGTLNVKDESVR